MVKKPERKYFYIAIDSETSSLICLFISISLCNSVFKYKFAIRSQIPQLIEFILCCFVAHFIAVENDMYHLEGPPEYFLWEDGLSGCCKASRSVFTLCDTSAVLPGMRGVLAEKTENMERKRIFTAWFSQSLWVQFTGNILKNFSTVFCSSAGGAVEPTTLFSHCLPCFPH